jgi:uncharacterized protein (TIGR02270 family)
VAIEPDSLEFATSRHIPVVILQHVEDAAILHATRTALCVAPHVALLHLRRFDDRLDAQLDGIEVAGEPAWSLSEAALAAPTAGVLFTVAAGCLQSANMQRLDRLLALAATHASGRREIASAFGWTEPGRLRGAVKRMLTSSIPLGRAVGVAACAVHRVDPGVVSARLLEDPDSAVRARALRCAGELGLRALVSTCAAAMNDDDKNCEFWAAWSAVLLGDRKTALQSLLETASVPGPLRRRAVQLAFLVVGLGEAVPLLRQFALDPVDARWLIRGAGLVGDPTYIPWLIGQMSEDSSARIAGEAFSFMTGTDLARLDLERKPPENFESGPNDDPNDPNTEMDEDDGLPWPDETRVQAWWTANSERFQPGTRYFMGEPLNRDNCLRVLKEGHQRQRSAAALYLSLLNPGTPLFEWRAPAWRQQRLLAETG